MVKRNKAWYDLHKGDGNYVLKVRVTGDTPYLTSSYYTLDRNEKKIAYHRRQRELWQLFKTGWWRRYQDTAYAGYLVELPKIVERAKLYENFGTVEFAVQVTEEGKRWMKENGCEQDSGGEVERRGEWQRLDRPLSACLEGRAEGYALGSLVHRMVRLAARGGSVLAGSGRSVDEAATAEYRGV